MKIELFKNGGVMSLFDYLSGKIKNPIVLEHTDIEPQHMAQYKRYHFAEYFSKVGNIYGRSYQKIGFQKTYNGDEAAAKDAFEQEILQTAHEMGFGSDDLGFIVNLKPTEAKVDAPLDKQIGRRIIEHTANNFVREALDKDTNIGAHIADHLKCTEKVKKTTVTADVYLYKYQIIPPMGGTPISIYPRIIP